MLATDDLTAKHARYVLSPWLVQGALAPPVIVRGEGVFLFDADGKRYLDLTSGLVAANLGHGHRTVLDAMHDQIERLCFSPPNWFNDARAELGEALATISPWRGAARVFFTTNGAHANEDAVRIARTVTKRDKVLTAYRSFHGAGAGAMTFTGEIRRWANEPGTTGVVRFWNPFPYRSPFETRDPREETARALGHLERTIVAENPDRIAALLLETVVGTNGVIVPPDGYLAGLRELCDRYGIVLIFDEVMTGFGRLGEAFASDRFGVIPDIMTFAKGVTSGYVPLGGVIVREELARYFDTAALPTGHTYAGHPFAVSAGLGALRAYREEGLFTRGRTIETWLREKLGRLRERHAIIGDVRGVGAFFALEFVAERETRAPLIAWQGPTLGPMPKLFSALAARGVYAFGRYNVVHVAPPLIITEAELDEGIAALDEAIGELTRAYEATPGNTPLRSAWPRPA